MKQTVVYKWCSNYKHEHAEASSLTGDLKQQFAWNRKKRRNKTLKNKNDGKKCLLIMLT